jgi:hypothetical protein
MGGTYTAISLFIAGFMFGHGFCHSDITGIAIGVGAVFLYSLTGGLNK